MDSKTPEHFLVNEDGTRGKRIDIPLATELRVALEVRNRKNEQIAQLVRERLNRGGLVDAELIESLPDECSEVVGSVELVGEGKYRRTLSETVEVSAGFEITINVEDFRCDIPREEYGFREAVLTRVVEAWLSEQQEVSHGKITDFDKEELNDYVKVE